MLKESFSGHALIITVANYSDPRLSLGLSVTRDGDAVEKTLLDPDRCAYQVESVKRLTDGQATRRAILQQLESWRMLPVDEPVFVYFSGHGYLSSSTDETGLCCYDTYTGGVGLLSASDFRQVWGELPAKRKLVVLDSCHAGGMPASKSTGGVFDDQEKHNGIRPSAFGADGGSVVMASSRSDQTSFILPEDSTSLFTKHFADGLHGAAGHDADGYVRVFDLFAYVRARVAADRPQQTPVLSTHELTEDFRVAYCAHPQLRKGRPTEAKLGESPEKALQRILPVLYPLGPSQDEIWERAGGDNYAVVLNGSGQSQWRKALRRMFLGGGGAELTLQNLITVALADYPRHTDLRDILDLCGNPGTLDRESS